MEVTLPPELARHLPDSALEAILTHVRRAEEEFAATVRGSTSRGTPYTFGGIKRQVAEGLFALVREVRPRRAVETGVCNGASTAVLLTALERNGEGQLDSLDFPEYTDTPYAPGTFWEGKLGAAVPRGKAPGWLVPTPLRRRWRLHLGRSQELLSGLLEQLGEIDFFLHDSEHSYECQSFEYRLAWQHLRPGGVLASDDISWSPAFAEFAAVVRRTPVHLHRKVAYLVK
ncbi:MAG: class I SAM-dependent methyltransferase [Acidobacteriota bacterium]